MPRGRPLPPLAITDEERETLERWIRRRKTAQALAQRARLVLSSAEGKSNKVVSEQVGLTPQTVGKWRRRYLHKGLDGLLDEPRPGAPRKITDADVESVVTLTLETTPDDSTHWSTRSMARRTGMSQSAISRIWRAFALQPHRTETFKLSTDPLFIEKVRDIVGLYLNPPDKALILCVDEKIGYPSAGSYRSFVAHASGTSRETYSRLLSSRNHRPVRCPRRNYRQGDRLLPTAPSFGRVPQVP